MQSIRLTDGTFAGRLIGKYGWSIGPTTGSRGSMIHREPSGAHASSSTSLHVDVHLRQLRSIVQMVNVNVANRIEQRLQAERSLTERVLVREIRELAARNGEARAVPRQDGQARAEPRQDGQARVGTRQVGPPQSGQRQEGTQQAGTRQVVRPQARPRQDGAMEAGQGRNMGSRTDPGQDGSLTAGQAVRREAAGAEATRAQANQLTHRTARSSDQVPREQGTGSSGVRPERQGEANAAGQPEGRNTQSARQERDRLAAGRNERSNESVAKQAASSRDERSDSETVAQLLARQQPPPRESERRTDRRLIELARRIEEIDPDGNPAVGMSRIGNAAPIGRTFPIRVGRNGAFSPQSLGGNIAERDEASRALRQATHWIRNQAWSVMPVMERATLPEHRSRTGPGIVYRTMRSLTAQDWNRLTVVERLRERLMPTGQTGQTGRRSGNASSERSTATSTQPSLLSFAYDPVRAAAGAQTERGLAEWRRPGTAALEPLRPVRSLSTSVTRPTGSEGVSVATGARDALLGSQLIPIARRSVAEEANVPRATIVWSAPGQLLQPTDSSARGTSLASSANRTAHTERTASDEGADNVSPSRATIVSAPTRRDDFLLVRALGQLARAGRLRERIEERHGLATPGTTAVAHADPETASRMAPVVRQTRSVRESSPAIVVRANEGEPRNSAPDARTVGVATPNARPLRTPAPIGQTVLRPIAAAGHGVPALVERVRKRAGEGLHAAVAAEQATNRPGAASTAASGMQSGTARQEHRQVRQVRISPQEADIEASETTRREAATGTGATETVQPGTAASAAGSAVAEATSRGSASSDSMASPELRHAAAAGPSVQAQGQASASRARVMPGPAKQDRFGSHRTAMKHAMRARQPLRRGNPGDTTASRATSLTSQPRATTTHLASVPEPAREAGAAPTWVPAAELPHASTQARPATRTVAQARPTAQAVTHARPATPTVGATRAPLGLQVAGRHARAANAAAVGNPPAIGTPPLVQAPAAASRGQTTRVPAAPGQAPDASVGPALVVPGIAPASAVSRAPVDLPLARLDVPARAAEKPGREEQAIRTLEVTVKTIEQELGQVKELWAKPKIDVNRLTDEMVKAVAKRMKQDRQRRGI